MPATHNKIWKNTIVSHHLSFLTLSNLLESEDTDCASFAVGIIVHSCLIQNFHCSKICGPRCLILFYMLRNNFQ